MDFDKAKILSRVRKLMALANDAGATEGERDNAIRMAHATLAKYNLSISEVEASGKTTDEKRVIDNDLRTIAHPWIVTVMHGIAALYFCEYLSARQRRGSHRTHYFIGRESNVITAREMGLFLIKAIQREASKMRRELDENGGWERDFCKGAAHKIYHRCAALRAEASKPAAVASTSTALVLASVYDQEKKANVALIAEKFGSLKSKKSRERGARSDAYHAGADFGSKVSLNHQLGNSGSNTARLK